MKKILQYRLLNNGWKSVSSGANRNERLVLSGYSKTKTSELDLLERGISDKIAIEKRNATARCFCGSPSIGKWGKKEQGDGKKADSKAESLESLTKKLFAARRSQRVQTSPPCYAPIRRAPRTIASSSGALILCSLDTSSSFSSPEFLFSRFATPHVQYQYTDGRK